MEPFHFRNMDEKSLSDRYKAPNLPLRPVDPNPVGKKIQVRVNQFKVSTWPQKTVYQYDVSIYDLEQFLFFSFTLSPRSLLEVVLKSVASLNSSGILSQFKMNYASGHHLGSLMVIGLLGMSGCLSYLVTSLIYFRSTANMHHPPDGEWRLLLDLDKEKGKSPRIDKVSGHPVPNTIRIRMKKVGEIRMSVIQAYLDGTIDFNNTVLEAISKFTFCAEVIDF